MRQVSQRRRNQCRIRDNNAGFIKSFHLGRTNIDLFNFPFFAADNNPVANLKRPFKQKNNTADKVFNHILQTKTDTNGKSTGDNREVRKVNPHRHNRQDSRNNKSRKAQAGNKRVLNALIHVNSVQQVVRESVFKNSDHRQRQQEHQQPRDNRDKRNINSADLKTKHNFFQRLQHKRAGHSPQSK